MIISVRNFEYDGLKKQLKPEDKIIVFSCNNCAKKCKGLGGRAGMNSLGTKLKADGYNVLLLELCGVACSLDLIRRRANEASTKSLFEAADVIIPLSCEDGERSLPVVFPGKRIIKVTKTLGIGWGSPKDGVRLTTPLSGINLKIDSPQGITIDEAADRLGLFAGGF
ncbi:hypothetical protein [uncultured Desulfobacter sp.]|uniref:hypothetical protein n=1 Tax=uncultured Desulfobacter sp. TaxID=240139 RepID=UPI002AAC0BC5|nr:hypothetical protein [uncultured Desulfobacter sp.]